MVPTKGEFTVKVLSRAAAAEAGAGAAGAIGVTCGGVDRAAEAGGAAGTACTAVTGAGGWPMRSVSLSWPLVQSSRVTSVPPRSADAGEVLPVAGVDLEDVSLVDEERDIEGVPRLEGGRLHGAGYGVAAHAGVAPGDAQLDCVGQLSGDGAPVPEEDVRVHVLLEEVPGLLERLAADVHLVIRLHVHEDVVVALLVEVLHLLLFDVRPAHLVARLQGGLEDPAGEEVADARAHERRALAWLHVLELDDLEGVPVVQDLESIPEFAGVVDLCHWASSEEARRCIAKPVVSPEENPCGRGEFEERSCVDVRGQSLVGLRCFPGGICRRPQQ